MLQVPATLLQGKEPSVVNEYETERIHKAGLTFRRTLSVVCRSAVPSRITIPTELCRLPVLQYVAVESSKKA
jgi:hypothetical protein